MAEPTLNDLHVDVALTDFSVALFQEEGAYIARRASSEVMVAQRSNKYFVYGKNDLLRSDAEKRSKSTPSAVRNYTMSTSDYYCERYSIAVDVSEEDVANADPALDPEEDAARVTVSDLRIRMDVDWSAAFFSTGVWATESTATWSGTTGDPIGDIATAVETILAETGRRANTLILGAQSWYSGLWQNAAVVARLPNDAPKIITTDFIANMFDFDNVLLAQGVRFSGDEGTTGSPSFIHDDHALVAFVDPNAGLREATAMKTFLWTGLIGGDGGIRTKRIEIPEDDKMPRVESDVAYDFKVISSDLGYLIKNTVS